LAEVTLLWEGITGWLRSVLLNATHFTVRCGVKMAQERRGAGSNQTRD